jgi:hypothetical protein
MENRIIKFRAWDKFNDQYWYSDKYKNLADFFCVIQSFIDGGNEITLEQYTGLHDKDGKEIYHFDIIGLDTINGIKPGWIVDWHDGYGCWGLKAISLGQEIAHPTQIHFWKSHEVIGSIRQNPELLK